MKKIAFFVEGQTEQIFICRLVKEILGYANLTIIQKKISGGANAPRREFVKDYSIARNSGYLVLINDCGSDNRVKSEILDNIDSLRENGFSKIIGIRDLYPLPITDLPRLEKGLKFLPHSLQGVHDPFDIVIAVREVETWFLAEPSHLMKLDKKLTGRFIEKHLGFDPYTINTLLREHPSEDLNRIFKLVGKSYTKKHWQVEKLVNWLDFKRIHNQVRYKLKALDDLISILEKFRDKKNA